MSAIWGIIDRENKILEDVSLSRMRDAMEEFKIDRFESLKRKNAYFACGHQYFTKEAINDVSPYYDEADRVFFVADCYLYNRDELIRLLLCERNSTYQASDLHECGDVELLYKMYGCFGEDFVTRLKGAFAIAVYEEDKGQLLLYTDHLAQRYLAYYCDKQRICFATVYQPLIAYLGKDNVKISDEWIAAAYTDCTADTLKLQARTVYEDIYQVEPGTYVKIDLKTGKSLRVTYWNPLHSVKNMKHMPDEEYKRRFLATFESTVAGLLRSAGETGIMLSGGLDSSTVAAFAAAGLAKEGKKLLSYTAVPADGYKNQSDRFHIEDESEFIMAQAGMYSNLESHFINVSERNCFTDMEEYAKLYMEPVKPVLNMINVAGMEKAAAEDGCRVLLSGQNGNATISYGSILTYIYQKSISGHFVAAYKEAKAFCRLRRVSGKRLLKVFFKVWYEGHFEKFVLGNDCLIKDEYIEKYNLIKLNSKLMRERGTGLMDSRKRRKGFCFMPLVFQHMGFFSTYSSLKHGFISLDPTLTKDMIEFCMSVPIDCNVRGGKERRMVRDYMKGYVPDIILDNHEGRGVQAADYAYRVNRDWEKIKDKVYALFEEPALRRYLSEEKLGELIKEAGENEGNMDKNLVARLALISSLACFLRS